MIQLKAQMVGWEEMKRLLHILPDEIKLKAMNVSVRKMGQLTLAHAKAYAPKGETGALQRSIRLIRAKRTSGPWHIAYGLAVKTARKSTRRMGFMEGLIAGEKKSSDDPYYWFFLEFGTVHIQPERRFLRKALEAHREEHVEVFKKDFTDRLKALAKKLYKKPKPKGISFSSSTSSSGISSLSSRPRDARGRFI